MPNIARSNIPSQLLEGIKENHGVGYKESDLKFKKFFDTIPSTKNLETYQEVGGFGLHQQKPEGQNTTLDFITEGPPTIISNLSFALGYEITHETLQDNQYPEILTKALDLGVSARQTKETHVLDRLNTGFSVAAADLLANGEALFSTTQPLSKAGGTIQNRPTVAASLSEASLTIDVQNLRNFKDPAGKRISVLPQMLFVPVELEVRGWKLLNTELSVGNNNNDLNPMRQNGGTGFFPKGLETSPFLSDPNAYFIRTSQRGLAYQNREETRIMEDVKVRAMVQQVISFSRYAVGAFDFRSVYGNPGA